MSDTYGYQDGEADDQLAEADEPAPRILAPVPECCALCAALAAAAPRIRASLAAALDRPLDQR